MKLLRMLVKRVRLWKREKETEIECTVIPRSAYAQYEGAKRKHGIYSRFRL